MSKIRKLRFQFIADHQAEFAVSQMCTALNVSPSGYYVWRQRPPSAREMTNQALLKEKVSQSSSPIAWLPMRRMNT